MNTHLFRAAVLSLILVLSATPTFAQTTMVRIGDMIMSSTQPDGLAAPSANIGVGALDPVRPWDGGIVPLDTTSLTDNQRAALFATCRVWSEIVAVQCVERTPDQSPFVLVTANQSGCYATVGRGIYYSYHVINLGDGCWSGSGTVAHELGHVFGMQHEHQREDRDAFVTIHSEHTSSSAMPALSILSGQTNGRMGDYDFLSVMHYHAYAFTTDGEPTIVPTAPYAMFASIMGQGAYPSSGDGAALRVFYGGSGIARPRLAVLSAWNENPVRMVWLPDPLGPAPVSYAIIAGSTRTSDDIGTVSMGTLTSFTQSIPGGIYYVRIRATYADGTTLDSNVVTIAAPGSAVFGTPTLNVPSVQGRFVVLSWTETSPDNTYTLYARQNGLLVATSAMTQSTFVIMSAPSGTYDITVASRYRGQTSNESNMMTLVVP